MLYFNVFQYFSFSLLFEILDNIGSKTLLRAAGIKRIIIFHWSAASYMANSEKFVNLTNIVRIAQKTGVTMMEDNAAGRLNLYSKCRSFRS